MAKFIKNKKFLLILIILILINGSVALALEIDWPRTPRPGGITLTDSSDVGDMIQYFYEWAIILGGLAVFFSLVMGGFKYLSSMGRPEEISEAKNQISSAFAGLILLLSSWLILNTINPDLTTFRRSSYNLEHIMDMVESFSMEELPGCDYVELYGSEDFGGSPLVIPGKGGDTKLERRDGYILMRSFFVENNSTPVSLKSFLNRTSEMIPDCQAPPCECEGHACGCILQLYAPAIENGVLKECGSKLGEIPAWDKNILVYEGGGPEGTQEISCIRLAGGTCQCRKMTADGGCTGEVSPNTGWGDNLYNCVGTNEDNNNARCVDGECVICEDGIIHDDGCNGCTNQGCDISRTDGVNSSRCKDPDKNAACWRPENSDQYSCNYLCDKYKSECAGLSVASEGFWNDDSSCTLCKLFFPEKDCVPWVWSNAPGWSHGSACAYRTAGPQNCNGVYIAMGRFCVCTF